MGLLSNIFNPIQNFFKASQGGPLGGISSFITNQPAQTGFSGTVSAPKDIGQSSWFNDVWNYAIPGLGKSIFGDFGIPTVPKVADVGYGRTLAPQGITTSDPYRGGSNILTGVYKNFAKGPGLRTPPAGGGGFGGTLGSIWDKFKGVGDWMGSNKGLVGAGLIGASMLKGMPKVPPMPSSIDDLRQMAMQGGNPWAQQAAQYYQEQMGKKFEPMSDVEIQARLRQIDEAQSDEQDQLMDFYKNIRPGADYENDSAFRRDMQDLHRKYADMKQETIGLATRDITNRLQDVGMASATGLGALGAQSMADLMQIAQLDVDQIALQLGVDMQQANFIKSTLANIGGAMLGPSLNPMTALMYDWIQSRTKQQ